jgi:hypothetical protein
MLPRPPGERTRTLQRAVDALLLVSFGAAVAIALTTLISSARHAIDGSYLISNESFSVLADVLLILLIAGAVLLLRQFGFYWVRHGAAYAVICILVAVSIVVFDGITSDGRSAFSVSQAILRGLGYGIHELLFLASVDSVSSLKPWQYLYFVAALLGYLRLYVEVVNTDLVERGNKEALPVDSPYLKFFAGMVRIALFQTVFAMSSFCVFKMHAPTKCCLRRLKSAFATELLLTSLPLSAVVRRNVLWERFLNGPIHAQFTTFKLIASVCSLGIETLLVITMGLLLWDIHALSAITYATLQLVDVFLQIGLFVSADRTATTYRGSVYRRFLIFLFLEYMVVVIVALAFGKSIHREAGEFELFITMASTVNASLLFTFSDLLLPCPSTRVLLLSNGLFNLRHLIIFVAHLNNKVRESSTFWSLVALLHQISLGKMSVAAVELSFLKNIAPRQSLFHHDVVKKRLTQEKSARTDVHETDVSMTELNSASTLSQPLLEN